MSLDVVLVSDKGEKAVARIPSSRLDGMLSLACGRRHCLIVDRVGRKVLSTGDNGGSQLGRGPDDHDSSEALPVFGLPTSHAITTAGCGREHSVVADEFGRVYSWGGTPQARGRIGPASTPMRVLKGLDDANIFITSISCGSDHTMILDRMGRVFGWGTADDGRLGVPGIDALAHPCEIHMPGNTSILSIACGSRHSLALAMDLRVFSTGASPANGSDVNRVRFEPVEQLCLLRGKDPITLIACGAEHSLVATNTSLMTFGDGSCGVLGTGDEVDRHVPSPVKLPSEAFPMRQIVGGRYNSMLLDANASIWICGLDKFLSHLFVDGKREPANRGPATIAQPHMVSRFAKAELSIDMGRQLAEFAIGDEFCVLVVETSSTVEVLADAEATKNTSIFKREADKPSNLLLGKIPAPLPEWMDELNKGDEQLEKAILMNMLLQERQRVASLEEQIQRLKTELEEALLVDG